MSATSATSASSIKLPERALAFRGVFLKTLRDYRVAILSWGLGLGALIALYLPAIDSVLKEPGAKQALIATAKAWNWYWEATGVDTPGGYAMWKLGPTIAFPAIWGLLAGSRTLRGEEERGALDVLLSLPRSRGRVAFEKVAALGAALLLMGLLIGVLTALGGMGINAGFSFGDAMLFGLNVSLVSAVFAALALFVSQFTHERGSAAGLTGALFGLAVLLNSLAHIAPETDGLAHISPVYLFGLSKPIIPGRGVDAVAMLVLASLALLFTVLGVALFLWRDVGAAVRLIPAPSRASTARPRPLPVNDPTLRSVYARSLRVLALPTLWWGLSLGFFGVVFTIMAKPTEQNLAQALQGTPFQGVIDALTGGASLGSGILFLSLIFAEMPLAFTIFALVQASSWAEDEGNGRYELLLATPQARWRVLFARYAAFTTSLIVLAVALLLSIMVTAAQQGLSLDNGRLVAATFGILPVALVISSVGYLIAGWVRSGVVTGALGALLAASFAVELLGGILKWPDWTLRLSIFTLYGSPLTKGLEWGNMLALVIVAAGTLLLATWRFARKDIGR